MDKRGQLILALDASQPSGSIALWSADSLIYSALFDISVTHSETLMPQVDQALRFCGCQPSDLQAVLLANGPGSFTGLRIGLATAKGIAYALKIPLRVFSSLKLAALPRAQCGKPILSVIDARMKEVYAALWDEHLNPIIAPCVCLPEEIAGWDCPECWVLGNGSHLLTQSPKMAFAPDLVTGFVPAAGLRALDMLEPGSQEYDFERIADLEPFYLRDSSAQVKRHPQ